MSELPTSNEQLANEYIRKNPHSLGNQSRVNIVGFAQWLDKRSAVETKAEPDIALDKDGPYCDEHLTDVRAWCVECMTCTAERKGNAVEPRETSARIGPADPDNDMVICPTCTSQFRAIPVNVQTKLTDAETFKRSIRISLEMWPEESPDEPRETTGPQPIGDYVLLSDMGETNVQGYGNCLFATHDAVKSPTHQETVLVDRTALLEWRAERAAEFLEDAPVTAKEVLSGNYDHEFRPTVETTEHLHWCAIRIDKTCNCRPVEPSGVLPPAFQSLLDLQPNWDSYGAKRINLACVQKAYEIWRQLAGIWLPVPHSDGTVGLEQHQGGFDIEIDVDLSLPPEKSSESSPDQLVGALQDRVHQDLGRVRAGRSVKVHKENCQKRLTGELNFKELSACDCDAEKASGEQS